MKRRKWLAGLGGALLIIGVFAPLTEILWIKVDFFLDGEGDGVVVLILLAVAAPLVLTQRFARLLWLPALLIAAVIVYDFFNIYGEVSDSPFASLGWGWLPLFGGAILMLVAAATDSSTE